MPGVGCVNHCAESGNVSADTMIVIATVFMRSSCAGLYAIPPPLSRRPLTTILEDIGHLRNIEVPELSGLPLTL
jgi:hypothetical protein